MKNVMLLTGAGQIGMAIARRMGAGMKIVVGDKKLENAQTIATTMNEAGFDVVPMEMDLSSRESILALIAEGQKYGPITMLVNAAGVSPSQAPIEAILKVDLYGTAVLLEEVGKVIAPGGVGVTISSQSGWRMPALTAAEDELLAITPTEELLALDTISDLDGLQVALAEIDENFVRKDLSDDEFRELLLRRKEIYESLHPETKHGGDRKSEKIKSAKCTFDSAKSFVDDTAEKLGVDPSTVRREIQTAKNLTPEAREIIKGAKITKSDALKLSRLAPEQQTEAASRLVSGDIHSVNEYQPPPAVLEPAEPELPAEAPPPSVPYSSSGRQYASFEESIADLKNPDKDCSYTPDALLAELDSFIKKFHREFEWYNAPFCTVVFPDISQVQFDYIQKRFDTISTAIHDLLQQMKRSMKK